MFSVGQHFSNHGIALQTVFAKVADPPEKTNGQCVFAYVFKHVSRHKKCFKKQCTDQQFREKTRTLKDSELAILADQWISRRDDGVSDQVRCLGWLLM